MAAVRAHRPTTMPRFLVLLLLALLLPPAPGHAALPEAPRRQPPVSPLLHSRAQWRLGLLHRTADGAPERHALATAGHLHLRTRRGHGWQAAVTVYGLADLLPGGDAHRHPDFYDAEGDGFLLLGDAWLDWRGARSELRLGRQSLDTPHLDADDVRLQPNRFRALVLRRRLAGEAVLTAGHADRMAGWGNGGDTARFVSLGEALGTGRATHGASWLAVGRDGAAWTGRLWAFRFHDVADLWYGELSRRGSRPGLGDWQLGLQWERARSRGAAGLGRFHSHTWGLHAALHHVAPHLDLYAAVNRSDGAGGTFPSLGGSPWFTAMEDLTPDAAGAPATAWVVSLGRPGRHCTASLALGALRARAGAFHRRQADAALHCRRGQRLRLSAVLSQWDDRGPADADGRQLRLIASLDFR